MKPREEAFFSWRIRPNEAGEGHGRSRGGVKAVGRKRRCGSESSYLPDCRYNRLVIILNRKMRRPDEGCNSGYLPNFIVIYSVGKLDRSIIQKHLTFDDSVVYSRKQLNIHS